jgi:hypothetical protein
VPAPPARSRAASLRSPASHATAAAAGAAPSVPSCMTIQAGGYSASGRPLTARNAVASPRLTRLPCAAIAVTRTIPVPAPSRARGSASTPATERGRFLAGDRGCLGYRPIAPSDGSISAMCGPVVSRTSSLRSRPGTRHAGCRSNAGRPRGYLIPVALACPQGPPLPGGQANGPGAARPAVPWRSAMSCTPRMGLPLANPIRMSVLAQARVRATEAPWYLSQPRRCGPGLDGERRGR